MKIIILLILSFVLVSCGPKKLAVKNADTLITYQITKRVPLYSAQKDELTKDVEKFLVRTKPTAKEIVPVFDELDFKNESKLEDQYQNLKNHYKKIAREFSLLMSKYIAKLDSKQQKEFFENLEEENKKLTRKLTSDQSSDIEDKFEMFFGTITDDQKKMLKEYSEYFKSRGQARLQRRIKLQEEMKSAFADDMSVESRTKMIQESFVDYQNSSLLDNKNLEIIKKIAPSLNTNQREYFKKEAQDIKETLKYFITVDY